MKNMVQTTGGRVIVNPTSGPIYKNGDTVPQYEKRRRVNSDSFDRNWWRQHPGQFPPVFAKKEVEQ